MKRVNKVAALGPYGWKRGMPGQTFGFRTTVHSQPVSSSTRLVPALQESSVYPSGPLPFVTRRQPSADHPVVLSLSPPRSPEQGGVDVPCGLSVPEPGRCSTRVPQYFAGIRCCGPLLQVRRNSLVRGAKVRRFLYLATADQLSWQPRVPLDPYSPFGSNK